MKKSIIMLATILVECMVLLGVSNGVGWGFIDIFFFGSLIIFGFVWMVSYFSNQTNKFVNSTVKAETGLETDRFSVSHVT